MDPSIHPTKNKTSRLQYIVPLVCILTFFITLSINLFVLNGLPHFTDEVVYLFQARILASGRLYLTGGIPDIQDYYFIYSDGIVRWSRFPFGWPLILSIGVLIGAPFIVNPLIHSLNVYLIYLIGSMLYGRKTGLISLFLAFLSPFMVFMGANFMPHTSELFFILLLFYAALKNQETGLRRYAIIAGFSLGYLILIRFYTGVLFGGAIWASNYLMDSGFTQNWVFSRKDVLTSLSVSLVLISSMLAYNLILTGNPLLLPYLKYTQRKYPDRPHCDSIGFGVDKGCEFGASWINKPPGHNLDIAWLNTRLNLKVLNTQLYGWPFSSLIFILILFSLGDYPRKSTVLMMFFLFLLVLYALYWSAGIGYGARYFYVAVSFLIWLTAEGILTAQEILENNRLLKSSDISLGSNRLPPRRLAGLLLGALIFLLFIWSFIDVYPTLLTEYGSNYQRNSSKFDVDTYNHLRNLNISSALIVVPDLYWGSGFLLNDLDLKNDVLMVREGGFNESSTLVATTYPDKKIYYYKREDDGFSLAPFNTPED